jgi:acyl carrier protein
MIDMTASPNSQFSADPQLIQQINDLLVQGFELSPEQIRPEAQLVADLGLDSLDAVDMLVFIEDKFGIKVDGEKMRGLKTLGDVYALAAEAVSNNSTAKVI